MRLLSGLRPIARAGALRDAVAGMTLASMSIPQVLGYTRIAGTPVVTGLYTLLAPLVAFAVFGSSRHLVVAADSATAAIFASSLSQMAPVGSPGYMRLVGAVALLTGLLLLLARVFRLGFLADFLSRTVLAGFLAGVGIQVGVAVAGEMLGVAIAAHSTVAQAIEIVRRLPEVHLPTLGVSAAVVTAILASRRRAPSLPVPLFAVIAGIGASAAFDFAARGIAVIGPVGGGLPRIDVPVASFREALVVLPVALSCFVVILAQSAATARALALRHRERVDQDADILGLGAANACAALTGTFVVNGSLTQTEMADRAGARSQLAQLVAAAVVVLVLLLLTGPLQYLPRAVLGGIVFTIAVGLVDLRGLFAFRRESPGEFALAIVTAAAVALVGIEQGILLAMGLSLLRHVRHSYRPPTSVQVPDREGRLIPVPAVAGVQTEPGLIVYFFGADLFYANEARFADEVRALVRHAPAPVRWLVVNAGAVTDIDYSAARMVIDLHAELRQAGVELAFARVGAYLRSDMDRHGITDVIGAQRLLPTLHEGLALARSGAEEGDAEG